MDNESVRIVFAVAGFVSMAVWFIGEYIRDYKGKEKAGNIMYRGGLASMFACGLAGLMTFMEGME